MTQCHKAALAFVIPSLLAFVVTGCGGKEKPTDVVLVTHASREAARAAATDPDPAAPRVAAAASSGLDPDRVAVTVTGRGEAGTRVRVEVAYRAKTAVPLIGVFVGDRTIRSSATMRVETPP